MIVEEIEKDTKPDVILVRKTHNYYPTIDRRFTVILDLTHVSKKRIRYSIHTCITVFRIKHPSSIWILSSECSPVLSN